MARRSSNAQKPKTTVKSREAIESEDAVLKPGYLTDYISGIGVKATSEEVEAVQVFARRLVEDYGYPKSNLLKLLF